MRKLSISLALAFAFITAPVAANAKLYVPPPPVVEYCVYFAWATANYPNLPFASSWGMWNGMGCPGYGC